jgi:PHB accumulation regulatory protein/poly(hydroxyalkanoate) granule associated protein phasin
MPDKHLIKKYANRKLYDTRTSRYITLEGISELVREGNDIEVVDRESGRDLTSLILSQIVTSEEKRGRNGATKEAAGQPASPLLDYVRRTLNVPASLVSSEVERRRGELEELVDAAIERALQRLSIPSRRELEQLERRLDEINRKLDQGRPRPARGAASKAKGSRTRTAAARR